MPELRWPALALVLVLITACDRAEQVHQHQFYAFGTLVEISLRGLPESRLTPVLGAVQEDLRYMHDTWHAWHPGSLGRINQLLPLGAEFSLPPSIQPLIEQAIILERQSGGLFNPAIGELVAAWGFAQDEPALGPPPDPDWIRDYLADLPQMADLEVRGIRMTGHNPRARLNLGGFAKGVAVDRIIERLREAGVANAIVNAGGDLRAIGDKGDRPWRIAIRHPDGKGLLASLTLHGDESVFTSGDYERFFEYDGHRYHHILDPRTGYPATGTRSLTVVHDNGAEADAASTALFIAGPGRWPAVAAAMGISQVLLVAEDMSIEMSPAMAARVQFELKQEPVVRILELP